MTSKEFDKCINNSRKSVGSEFGFKKSGYVSYKIAGGYFFYLLHLVDASVDLKVKPFYADDLWCDIFQIPEAKKPISLRGNGAFALSGETIASYDTFPGKCKNYTESDIWDVWESVFNEIEYDIHNFISQNPSADLYMPPSTNARGDVSLSYLVALLHNNKVEEVIDLVTNAIREEQCSGMSKYIINIGKDGSDVEKDAYSFILDYAKLLR